jgi:CBS domain-containing protein
MTVAKLLSRKGGDVVTIEPTTPIKTVIELLEKHGIGALVAVHSNRAIAGILSERDVVRGLSRHGAEVLGKPASALMTKKVITCKPSDRVVAVMGMMSDGKFRHVPVEDDGKLAGIISIGDVVKQRIAEIQLEKDALQDYIMAS